jgi:hypothetical protein
MEGTVLMERWDETLGVMKAIVWPPIICPGCGVPSCMVVNHEGKTVCVSRCYEPGRLGQ